MGMTVEAAADGVLTIINANMANAIRSRTVQKGHDPREFSLVAFGGAGPLHGVDVARDLGIPEVIIPPYPGITSAAGLLTTDLKYDAIRTEFQVSGNVDGERLSRDFDTMRDGLAAQFKTDGLDEGAVAYQRSGDLRYVGQGYELRVPVADGPVDAACLADIFKAFEAIHTTEYGHVFEDNPIEIVNIRVTGVGQMPKIELPTQSQGGNLKDALLDEAQCNFRQDGDLQAMATPLYQRDKLPIDQPLEGPAIILQKDTTTVIPPGARATAQAGGNLLIETGA
ncbi:MAG: hydantoinase/oxoprolinase family protein, partial [Rhodospirillaceae bacterium]|nr:hydantoinase/oxoprolinase family protein [Rhodospirillaceae bacterium]